MILRTLQFRELKSLHRGQEVCSSHFQSCLFQSRDRCTCSNLYSDLRSSTISRSSAALVLFACSRCICGQLSTSLPRGSFQFLLIWNLRSQVPFNQAGNECRLVPNKESFNLEGNWIEVDHESSRTCGPTLQDTHSFSRSTLFLLFSCQSGK